MQKSRIKDEGALFTLHHYLKSDGSFDYEKYREIQVEGNKRKIENIWVQEENIAFLAGFLKEELGRPRFGLCHGTRRGKEQEWFRKYLECEVLGTEISDTATEFQNTIQWDFHNVKPEWIDAVDFIYSNSFDHSYDPEKCLNAWMTSIRLGGICILEHSFAHAPEFVTELDPFGAAVTVMPYLIATWGRGRYAVRWILDACAQNTRDGYIHFLAIQRFRH